MPGPVEPVTAVSITRAREEDTAGLTACIEAAYAPYRARGLRLPPVSEGVAEDIAAHHVWVARAEGRIVGGLILSVEGEQAYLKNIAVDPGFAGRGIGRELIGAALAMARDCGCLVMQLTTHAGLPENIALYRHMGWEVTAREDQKVAMERPLSAP